MAKLLFGAIAAIATLCLLSATTAFADIEVKAGCDGKWVERSGAGFETYKVCQRETPTRLSALRMRAHPQKRLVHARVHKRLVAHGYSRRVVEPIVVAAASPAPRREGQCVNLNCPQFILIGIGY